MNKLQKPEPPFFRWVKLAAWISGILSGIIRFLGWFLDS
jgi:hypothetical protein